MNTRILAYGLIVFFVSIVWNIFLIQRDEKMFNAYEKKAALQRLSYPPSNSLKTWCERQAGWHPDCNIK